MFATRSRRRRLVPTGIHKTSTRAEVSTQLGDKLLLAHMINSAGTPERTKCFRGSWDFLTTISPPAFDAYEVYIYDTCMYMFSYNPSYRKQVIYIHNDGVKNGASIVS